MRDGRVGETSQDLEIHIDAISLGDLLGFFGIHLTKSNQIPLSAFVPSP